MPVITDMHPYSNRNGLWYSCRMLGTRAQAPALQISTVIPLFNGWRIPNKACITCINVLLRLSKNYHPLLN